MRQAIIKSGGLFGSWFWCPGNPKAWYQHLVRAFLLHPDMTESIMWCDGPSVLPQGSLPPLIKVTNIITGAPRSYSHLIWIFLSRVPSLSIISIWIWGLSLQHLNFGNIFKLKKAPCGNDMTLQHKAPLTVTSHPCLSSAMLLQLGMPSWGVLSSLLLEWESSPHGVSYSELLGHVFPGSHHFTSPSMTICELTKRNENSPIHSTPHHSIFSALLSQTIKVFYF